MVNRGTLATIGIILDSNFMATPAEARDIKKEATLCLRMVVTLMIMSVVEDGLIMLLRINFVSFAVSTLSKFLICCASVAIAYY